MLRLLSDSIMSSINKICRGPSSSWSIFQIGKEEAAGSLRYFMQSYILVLCCCCCPQYCKHISAFQLIRRPHCILEYWSIALPYNIYPRYSSHSYLTDMHKHDTDHLIVANILEIQNMQYDLCILNIYACMYYQI